MGDSPFRLAPRARPVDGFVRSDDGFHRALLALEACRSDQPGVVEVSGVADCARVELRHDLGRAPLRPDRSLFVQEVSGVSDVHRESGEENVRSASQRGRDLTWRMAY